MVHVLSNELLMQVSRKRLWYALVEDAHNCFPKCLGERIDFIEHVEGPVVDVGCVRTVKFHNGAYMTEKFEELDKENLKAKLDVIDGNIPNVVFKHYKIGLDFKEGAQPGTTNLHSLLEYEGVTTEEEVPGEVTGGMFSAFKVVEAFLITNSELYA